jgi:hypothetical protein
VKQRWGGGVEERDERLSEIRWVISMGVIKRRLEAGGDKGRERTYFVGAGLWTCGCDHAAPTGI